jgi:hypothetical protein
VTVAPQVDSLYVFGFVNRRKYAKVWIFQINIHISDSSEKEFDLATPSGQGGKPRSSSAPHGDAVAQGDFLTTSS